MPSGTLGGNCWHSARAWLGEEHQMGRLDLARIQMGMTLTNRLEFVPGSIDPAANTNRDVLPYWVVWDTSAAAAGADALTAAPL